jgi:hypothetical protein
MSEELVLVVSDIAEARAALVHKVPNFMRNLWKRHARIRLTVSADEDDTSVAQFRFYWGFVLKTISQQALVNGFGAQADGWHLFYKKLILGYQIRKVQMPGKKEPEIVRELKSTTALKARRDGGEADPSKYMPDYLEAVMAHAAKTHGVQFPADQRWEDWRESDVSRIQAI